MFEDKSGRLIKTVEEAETYLWKFIAENRTMTDPRMIAHLHDFDLFMPWMLEIFDTQGHQPDEAMSLLEMQRVYMDAAWALVMKGYLRPGPKNIGGDQTADGYGKGYSLTREGLEKVETVLFGPDTER
jgi:hypothetical protein